MRILFTFVGGWGHAEPLMPLAHATVTRGHDLLFSAQAGMVAQVKRAGFTCVASGPSTLRTEKSPLIPPDREAEVAVVRDVFEGFVATGRAADLDPIVRSWRPDVLVCDEVDFGAMAVAAQHGVPYASVVVIASGTFVSSDVPARHLLLAPGPPSFRDPTAPLPATGLWMQPAVHAAPRSPRAGRPFVYVTLGTIFNLESGDLFSRVLAGVAPLDVDVLVTVGPHLDPAELGPQPSNVRVEAFVPQADVLPLCDAVVCHGGSGTVVGALSCGVPLVVLAMGADQLDNADRCTALGVGISLGAMRASADDIAVAATRVLTERSFRDAAAALAAEVTTLPDASTVLEHIEELVSA